MTKNIIVHVSEVDISTTSGMGRVEFYWKKAFEKEGFTFIHIGPTAVGKLSHKYLFPIKAYRYFRKLKIIPKAFIVHEPAAGYFVNRGIPCFVESHGVERRFWEWQLRYKDASSEVQKISLKTRLLFPLWRLNGCDKGLSDADHLLLINSEDKEYVKQRYKRNDKDIMIFKNGASQLSAAENLSEGRFTILFNGSWLERKGIRTLVDAAIILHREGLQIKYLLIGTGKIAEDVLADWKDELKGFVKVVPNFSSQEEAKYLTAASMYVLPSFFEGQPLSLLQAMAAGKCCITTNCCGQKDIIEHEKTGLLFEAGNVSALVSLIRRCYTDRGMMNEIGKRAREHLLPFTWEKVSGDVVNYIKGALHGN